MCDMMCDEQLVKILTDTVVLIVIAFHFVNSGNMIYEKVSIN